MNCEKENQPPFIKSTTANPQVIKTGEMTQLTCVATDPDDDLLTYSWSSSNGTFPDGTFGISISWNAPDESETYNISVTVNDGYNFVVGNINVVVEENPILRVTPTELIFKADERQKIIWIENTGTGTLAWTLPEDLNWLTFDQLSGSTTTEKDSIIITVNRSELSPGIYDDLFAIATNGGNKNIAVSMTVEEFQDTRDGNSYKWVKIGDQIWMAENLAYLPTITHPIGGSYIYPCYYVYGYEGTNITEAKATDNYNTMGVLYNWTAAITACPSGWHIPNDQEWEQLAQFVSIEKGPYERDEDGWNNVGKHLKATSGWYYNKNGTDDYGLSCLPGGRRNTMGGFHAWATGSWWSATEYSSVYTRRYWNLNSTNDNLIRGRASEEYGFSIRCMKD